MASDLIYREDAKVFVRHACYKKINPIDYLDEVPAADVRPVVRGEWKPHLTNRCRDVCSVCGVSTLRRTYGINPDGTEWVDEASYPFCPWCAADMRGGV